MIEAAFIVLLVLAAVEAALAAGGRPGYLVGAIGAANAVAICMPYLSYRPVTMALAGLAAIAWLLFRDRRLSQRSAR